GDEANLRVLADYVIGRHYPELADAPRKYLEFFRAVADRQASLVARWQLVGFIHGVMNTDNVAVSGETIDYGPCAFMNAVRRDAEQAGAADGRGRRRRADPVAARLDGGVPGRLHQHVPRPVVGRPAGRRPLPGPGLPGLVLAVAAATRP